MNDMNVKNDEALKTYRAREAVATFPSAGALEKAVDKLEIEGVDRSLLSVLGTDPKAKEWLARRYGSTVRAAERARAERDEFVSVDSKTEGKAAAVAAPLYVGSVAGAFAVVASGGTLGAAVAVAVAAGAAGGGLGALVANVIGQQHAANVTAQIDRGGLVLWVALANEEMERRVLEALRSAGGEHVHVHEIDRQWGAEKRPLSDVQPDPFLEADRTGAG